MIHTDLKQMTADIRRNPLLIRVNLLIGTLLLLFPIFYFLLPMSTLAQSFSLGIYPPLLEVMIMPGKSVTQKYELTNGESETTLIPSLTTFSPNDEYGHISLNPPLTINHLPLAIQFDNPTIGLDKPFTLSPNEVKSLVLKITIPNNASENDYYFTLLFSSEARPEARGSGLYQVGVIGSHLLITVSKDGKPLKTGEISEFRLSNSPFTIYHLQFIDSFDQPQYEIRLKNTSKTYWKPFGKIITNGILGQTWEQELLPDNILGNSIRQIQVATPSANPRFLLGPYRAKIEFNPDQEETKIRQTISYFAFPFKGLMGIIIAFVIIKMIASFYAKTRT